MTLTLLNCEQETVDINTEIQQEKKLSRISFNHFKTLVNVKSLTKLEEIFSSNNSNKRTTSSDPTVLMDDIIRVQFEDYATYTFKIVAETEANEFYNLVLHVNNQQEITKSNILKYTPSESWLSDPTQYFSGNVAVMNNNFFDLSSLTDVLRNDSCITSISTEWTCEFGNAHYQGHPECTDATWWEFYIVIETGSCSGSSNDGGNFDPFGSNPNNSGGPSGGGSPDGNNINTSPNVLGDIDVFLANANAVATGLEIQPNTLEYAWLTNYSENEDKVNKLVKYLNDNGFSAESKDLANQIVKAGKNNILVSAFPFVKYPEGSDYTSRYHKLTEYLKNQIPKVADIPKIVNAINEFTQLPSDEIKNALKWGEGPVLHVSQLDNYPGCSTCSIDTVGYFDRENPDNIYLDIDYVNLIEDGNVTETDDDAYIFFLGTTILHELVHWGEFNNENFTYEGEEGRHFEFRVYNANVNPDNARLILDRYEN